MHLVFNQQLNPVLKWAIITLRTLGPSREFKKWRVMILADPPSSMVCRPVLACEKRREK
jgi:hypothetical protein